MLDQLFIPSSIIECAWEFVQPVYFSFVDLKGIQTHSLEYPVGCALGFWPIAKRLLLAKSWTIWFYLAQKFCFFFFFFYIFMDFVEGAKWQKVAKSFVFEASESCLCFLWSLSYCWLYLLCSGTMDFRKVPRNKMYYYYYHTAAYRSHCSSEWDVNWQNEN